MPAQCNKNLVRHIFRSFDKFQYKKTKDPIQHRRVEDQWWWWWMMKEDWCLVAVCGASWSHHAFGPAARTAAAAVLLWSLCLRPSTLLDSHWPGHGSGGFPTAGAALALPRCHWPDCRHLLPSLCRLHRCSCGACHCARPCLAGSTPQTGDLFCGLAVVATVFFLLLINSCKSNICVKQTTTKTSVFAAMTPQLMVFAHVVCSNKNVPNSPKFIQLFKLLPLVPQYRPVYLPVLLKLFNCDKR